MMNITHRVIGAFAPAAQNFYLLQKKVDQIFELQQQIQTTNPKDKHRVKKLQQKLKQLEHQQGLSSSQCTSSSSASDCSPPGTFVLLKNPLNLCNYSAPTTTSINPLNAAAAEWSPHAARMPEPFPAPASPPTPEPSRVVRFTIPAAAEHVVHQAHKWGPGGLNPLTHKLLGSDLLAAINEMANSHYYSAADFDDDDDDDSEFYPESPATEPVSFIDSGYESNGSRFSSDEN